MRGSAGKRVRIRTVPSRIRIFGTRMRTSRLRVRTQFGVALAWSRMHKANRCRDGWTPGFDRLAVARQPAAHPERVWQAERAIQDALLGVVAV